jgi:hypothetical protein
VCFVDVSLFETDRGTHPLAPDLDKALSSSCGPFRSLQGIDLFPRGVSDNFLLGVRCEIAEALPPLHGRMGIHGTEPAVIIAHDPCAALAPLNDFKAGSAHKAAAIPAHEFT